MPNRIRRTSVVDMIARVPVHRGSLLKSIENLLKTIESSENSVMIPTLLRDKVRVDAWELLFVAKILKASILGHSDLVEFYMNHIGHHHSTLQQQAAAAAAGPAETPGPLLSPTLSRQQSASPIASPLTSHSSSATTTAQDQQQQPAPHGQSASPSSFLSAGGSAPANGVTGPASASGQQSQRSTTASWITASQQEQQHQQQQTLASASSANLAASLSCEWAGGAAAAALADGAQAGSAPLPVPSELPSALEAARPLLVRQAQPPSLLQLTTTNNHINSMAASFTNFSLEQLSNQLGALSPNGTAAAATNLDNALSISTGGSAGATTWLTPPAVAGQPEANSSSSPASQQQQQPARAHQELRTSRSAGCLLRGPAAGGAHNGTTGANSGASSPRTPAHTPTTPYPQAETLANGQANGLVGDPSAPVKLLLQIEQLKVSISHVTTLLESVVELYKNSIDNIAQ